MEPFCKTWKGLAKLSTENFRKAILSVQKEDFLHEVGFFSLRIQETFELDDLWIN